LDNINCSLHNANDHQYLIVLKTQQKTLVLELLRFELESMTSNVAFTDVNSKIVSFFTHKQIVFWRKGQFTVFTKSRFKASKESKNGNKSRKAGGLSLPRGLCLQVIENLTPAFCSF
jgi:hypothetical protein